MLRRIAGALLALSIVASFGGNAHAESPAAFYDAPAIVGASQAESLHALATGRLARLRALRPGGAALPTITSGGPTSRALTSHSLSGMIAGVQDLPIFAGGYHDFGLWGHGYGRRKGVGNGNDALGFSSTLAGGSIGIDRAVGEHWVIGAMAGVSAGTITWNGGEATGAATGSAVALYAGYANRDVFLDLSVSTGWTQADSGLSPDSGLDRTDMTIGARIDGGFDIDWAGFKIRPSFSATFLSVDTLDGNLPPAGLGGDGPSAFAVEDVDRGRMRQIQTQVGVRISRDFVIGGRTLTANGGVTWRRGLTFDSAPPSAGRDDRLEPIRKIRIDHDSVDPQLGLSLQLGEGWNVFARYDGHFAGDLAHHKVTGGLRARF